MIETIQDDILTQLQKIDGIADSGVWQGDVEDLLKSPQRMPSLNVIYQGAEFTEKRVINLNRADHTMDFLIVLICRNLKSRDAGASSAYTIIEAVRNYLVGHKIEPYGWLWPVREDLLAAEKGILAYGLVYSMQTNMLCNEPPPPAP